jgi:circadian clock protein KaiB
MTATEHTRADGLDSHAHGRDAQGYAFTLFVSGASDASARAIEHVREICDARLPGRHDLSIVDLNQEPALAAHHHVLATPTLVRDRPLPSRMVVGDMSDHQRILAALDVVPGASGSSGAHRAEVSPRDGAS